MIVKRSSHASGERQAFKVVNDTPHEAKISANDIHRDIFDLENKLLLIWGA